MQDVRLVNEFVIQLYAICNTASIKSKPHDYAELLWSI